VDGGESGWQSLAVSTTNQPTEKMDPSHPHYEIQEDIIDWQERENSPEMLDYRSTMKTAKSHIILQASLISTNDFSSFHFLRLVESVLIYNNLKKTHP
jgi:hypothetical protein